MKSHPILLSAIALAGLIWFGLLSVQTSAAQVTWSADIHLSSKADIAHAMSTPLLDISTGVAFTNGTATRQLKTCHEYLDSVSAGFYPKDNLAQQATGSFVFRCYVLRDLQAAKAATSGKHYYWTSNSLSQLPPILVVGAKDVQDAAEKADQNGISWQQYNPRLKITSVTADRLQAEDEDNSYTLNILARGDFNGDGVEDFAVVGTAKGKQTTWVSNQYFIFTQSPTGNLVRLTSNKIPYRLAANRR